MIADVPAKTACLLRTLPSCAAAVRVRKNPFGPAFRQDPVAFVKGGYRANRLRKLPGGIYSRTLDLQSDETAQCAIATQPLSQKVF